MSPEPEEMARLLEAQDARRYEAALAQEIRRQDEVHPDGYPATRDGVRLALSVAQDELEEALDAWRWGRCKCPVPLCGHAVWDGVEEEIIQTMAVLARSLRSIRKAKNDSERTS